MDIADIIENLTVENESLRAENAALKQRVNELEKMQEMKGSTNAFSNSIYSADANPLSKISSVIDEQNENSLRKKIYIDVPQSGIWNPSEDVENDQFIKDMMLVESIRTKPIKKEQQKLGYSTLQIARYS